MTYDDIISDTTKGATEGFLNWSSNTIKELVSKLRHGNLGFIQDEKTIQIVKEQYNSGELAIYKEYIEDKEMLFLLKMGLTLRRLEKENDATRKINLRNKIFNKYEVKGLHIAQFVENGILNRYVGILIDDIVSIDKFKKDIIDILNNIEKHVLFVKTDDNDRSIIKQSVTIVTSHGPMIFIVSGLYSAAKTVRICEERLGKLLTDYVLEKMSSGQKEVLFFKRILKT